MLKTQKALANEIMKTMGYTSTFTQLSLKISAAPALDFARPAGGALQAAMCRQ
jgi:hypothetical protein